MPKRLTVLAVAALILTATLLVNCSEPRAATQEAATHVGAAACASCHDQQHVEWQGSHHDFAMQPATPETVLGNFDDQTFTHFGVTSTFSRKDGDFFVRTDGPDGELADYLVKYCFGVTPLQQYLIEFPGGRLQTLSLCWDSRPAEQDGQRWFHLYPDEKIAHSDPLHWTAHQQTWNHQCASCHSTNLRRNYDLERDHYDTSWSEIDVACEACHGPGSRHVAWGEAVDRGEASADDAAKGLLIHLPGPGAWAFEPGAVIATRRPALETLVEVDTCAPCHARRTEIHQQPALGQSLSDGHRPAILEQRLYHADGQILDEVYVWGSFVQSKMYQAGVTCSDCHDTHSLQLRAPDNALCTRCHLSTEFDAPTHHFHEAGTPGSHCVDCHMRARTYMVVDPRHDHSFRVPRPDLTIELGTPNACADCHDDQSAQWAADAVAGWFPDRERPPHYGQALHAGFTGQLGAERALLRLATDGTQPGIARATALEILGPGAQGALPTALRDPDPLVRRAALTSLEGGDPNLAARLGAALLNDPVRSVRIEACRIFERAAANDPQALAAMPPALKAAWQRAMEELAAMQQLNADQPWAHVNQALSHLARGDRKQAEQAYQTALRIDPASIEASFNLADLYRELKRDDLAETVLRSALKANPGSPELGHSLGLVLVRARRYSDALSFLENAAAGRPENLRFGYVFAIALHETGDVERSIEVLERLHGRFPRDRSVLEGLVIYNRQRGNDAAAQEYATKLEELEKLQDAARRR